MFELLFGIAFLFLALGIVLWLIKVVIKAILYLSGTVIVLILILAFFPVFLILLIVGFKLLLFFILLLPLIIAGIALKFLIAPFI